jgi:hypothetical protein
VNEAAARVTVVGVVDGVVAPVDAPVEGTVADGDVAVAGWLTAIVVPPRVTAGLSTPGCGTLTIVHPLPEAALGSQIGT